MKYRDSVEKSAEYLRLALQLMTKQAAALHPISYAVWYEYVSGINPALTAAVDERLRNGDTIDEKSIVGLYHRHVADINNEIAQRVTEGFQKVMADMAHSATQAGDEAGLLGTALEKWRTDLSGANPGASIDAILGLTRNMRDSVATLKARLEESRGEIELLRQEVVKAREDAMADGLTGLANRRGFDMALATCLAESDAATPSLSLLITDIDHFKRVNDNFGHLFGDRVIKAVAQILKDNVKGKDTAARYGGEEFVVLLPDTPVEGARMLAEKIRVAVEKCRIKRTGGDETVANFTVSLGVASLKHGESASEFVARADAALYASKNGGRNRVTVV